MLTSLRHDALPPLAWLLDWDGRQAMLHCGCGVEVREHGWFEGVWAGDFEAWDFDRAADVFGSGGLVHEGRLSLVTPSHCLEPLFIKLDGVRVSASNSLAFLLAHAGDGIREDDFSYAERFLSVLNGIDHVHFSIPSRKGRISVLYHFNATFDSDGHLITVAKPPTPELNTYERYIGHLAATTERVLSNAAHPGRQFRFKPLSTLSRGYDSPACTIIAQAAGCAEAVSFEASLDREGGRQLDDCGAEIGRQLGVQVKTYRRALPPDTAPSDLAQFYCDGGTGGEVFWLAMAESLPGRALVTGVVGGQYWTAFRNERTLFEKNDCSGLGLGEFRRRVGFAHIPLPYIAATRLGDIQRIARSEEMAPWSIGGDYDKPIARRIVEEAGIPRSAFGQTKTGNSFRAWYPDHWPASFREQFQAYRKTHPMSVRARWRYGWKLARLQILRFSCERRFLKDLARRLALFGDGQKRLYPLLASLSGALRIALRPFSPTPYKIIIRMHPRYTFLLAWATGSAAERYASALAAAPSEVGSASSPGQ
jgi:hypothetical protein